MIRQYLECVFCLIHKRLSQGVWEVRGNALQGDEFTIGFDILPLM
jgi:hypothetical protein